MVVGVPRHQAIGRGVGRVALVAVRGADLEERPARGAVSAQVCASGPVPITGKAAIRSRAAPIGMRVTVSMGWSDFTGLSCSGATRPNRSSCHWGIRLAFAFMLMGTRVGRERHVGPGPVPLTTWNEEAGPSGSSTRP